jgi:hypothetical protein
MQTCPECGHELGWIRINEDPDGGWWQCDGQHQYRVIDGKLVPLG